MNALVERLLEAHVEYIRDNHHNPTCVKMCRSTWDEIVNSASIKSFIDLNNPRIFGMYVVTGEVPEGVFLVTDDQPLHGPRMLR